MRKEDAKVRKGKEKEETSSVGTVVEDIKEYMIFSMISSCEGDSSWILDSDCLFHVYLNIE